MYTVSNIRGQTTLAERARQCVDETSANNVARNYSKDFFGVFAVQRDGENVRFYVAGRQYRKLETAWLAR